MKELEGLTRYDPETEYIGCGDYIATMGKSADGEYVLLADVSAALEAMRKDAERYRWLRDGGLYGMNYKDRGAGPEFASGDDFDAEVDLKKSVA